MKNKVINKMKSKKRISKGFTKDEIVREYYDLISYNCLNYSSDLSFVLNSLGYSSKVIIFSTNGDGSQGHAIVRIDSIYVEPQSGKIYGSFESLLNGEDLTASETNQTSVIPQEYLPVTCVDGVCE